MMQNRIIIHLLWHAQNNTNYHSKQKKYAGAKHLIDDKRIKTAQQTILEHVIRQNKTRASNKQQNSMETKTWFQGVLYKNDFHKCVVYFVFTSTRDTVRAAFTFMQPNHEIFCQMFI